MQDAGTTDGGATSIDTPVAGIFHFTALKVVLIAGVLGAMVSGLRRMPELMKELRDGTNYSHRWMIIVLLQFVIPMIIGLVSSAVLYVIFAGGMLIGPLFPEFAFSPTSKASDSFDSFLSYWSPAGAQEHAKAIVWGFIAGFSERLVPNLLGKIGGATDDENKTPKTGI